ncbi:MAG: VTT domain-containing protein, partial [Clostridiales Family XIII bacterium]|nr:VTT domain-containing protein [Clostridiales Family XIII bacterium]
METKYSTSVVKTVRTMLAILKFLVLLGIIAAVPIIIYLKYPHILEEFRSIEQVNALLDRYQAGGALFYVGFQIIQVVISVIPGQPLQLAAGYAFGVPLGFATSLIGIAIGTVITYYLGKIFGKDMIWLIFGEKRLGHFVRLLESKRAFIIVFLLYLFPGIPKDIFSYAAGISNMRPIPFLAISMAGRAPALLAS